MDLWRELDVDQGNTVCEGGAPNGSCVRAHQVNLNESLTVLTRFWADEVEVWWKAEAFDASSTEAAVWEGP